MLASQNVLRTENNKIINLSEILNVFVEIRSDMKKLHQTLLWFNDLFSNKEIDEKCKFEFVARTILIL